MRCYWRLFIFFSSHFSELTKLSEESLTRQPEEVFDIICKLGEGSYGSVFKALHKESGQVLAIKQVPVDTDLQEIIKEISIMQQCDSPYVVKYYGSYFKNTDLWVRNTSSLVTLPSWMTTVLVPLHTATPFAVNAPRQWYTFIFLRPKFSNKRIKLW